MSYIYIYVFAALSKTFMSSIYLELLTGLAVHSHWLLCNIHVVIISGKISCLWYGWSFFYALASIEHYVCRNKFFQTKTTLYYFLFFYCGIAISGKKKIIQKTFKSAILFVCSGHEATVSITRDSITVSSATNAYSRWSTLVRRLLLYTN